MAGPNSNKPNSQGQQANHLPPPPPPAPPVAAEGSKSPPPPSTGATNPASLPSQQAPEHVTTFVNTPTPNVDAMTAEIERLKRQLAERDAELVTAKKVAEQVYQGNVHTGGEPGWYRVVLEEQEKDAAGYFTDHLPAESHADAVMRYCYLKGIQIDEGRPNTRSPIKSVFIGKDRPPIDLQICVGKDPQGNEILVSAMKLKYTIEELQEFGYSDEEAAKYGRAPQIIRESLEDLENEKRRLELREELVLKRMEREERQREAGRPRPPKKQPLMA